MTAPGEIRMKPRMPFHPDPVSTGHGVDMGTSPQRGVGRSPIPQPAETCDAGLPLSAQISCAHAGLSRIPDADRLRQDLLRLLPEFRQLAQSITPGGNQAEDLVQEALIRAWQSQDHYRPSTDVKAWIFAMMRDSLCPERQNTTCEVFDVDAPAPER